MPPTFRPAFGSKTYRSLDSKSIEGWYRRKLNDHPFLLFGLPFLTVIVGSSFLLTPATALRYERHDMKVHATTREEAFALPESQGGGVVDPGEGPDGKKKSTVKKRGRRVFDLNEEYYRLATKDIDNWQQKRVKRLPGERDGRL